MCQLMGMNLRGEMTVARTKEEYSLLEYSLIEKMVDTMQLSSNEVVNIMILRYPNWPRLGVEMHICLSREIS